MELEKVLLVVFLGALLMSSVFGCGEIYIGHSYYGRQHHDRRDVSEESSLDDETPRSTPHRYERMPK